MKLHENVCFYTMNVTTLLLYRDYPFRSNSKTKWMRWNPVRSVPFFRYGEVIKWPQNKHGLSHGKCDIERTKLILFPNKFKLKR